MPPLRRLAAKISFVLMFDVFMILRKSSATHRIFREVVEDFFGFFDLKSKSAEKVSMPGRFLAMIFRQNM